MNIIDRKATDMFEKIKNYHHKIFSLFGTYRENMKICNMDVHFFEIEENKFAEYIENFTHNSFTPIQYNYMNDNTLSFLSLNKHKDFMFDVIKNFCNDLFSQNCFDYVYNYISDDLKKQFNIIPNSEMVCRYLLKYGVFDKNELNLSKIQKSALKYDEAMEHNYNKLYYGIWDGDKLASWACWNNYEDEYSNSKDDEVIDIGVGTNETYRNKGYAVSNVVAMAEYILEAGKIATYTTNNMNIASQKTATAAGLSEIGKEKMFHFMKID